MARTSTVRTVVLSYQIESFESKKNFNLKLNAPAREISVEPFLLSVQRTVYKTNRLRSMIN
jgi:hypothetical protein